MWQPLCWVLPYKLFHFITTGAQWGRYYYTHITVKGIETMKGKTNKQTIKLACGYKEMSERAGLPPSFRPPLPSMITCVEWVQVLFSRAWIIQYLPVSVLFFILVVLPLDCQHPQAEYQTFWTHSKQWLNICWIIQQMNTRELKTGIFSLCFLLTPLYTDVQTSSTDWNL